MYFWKTKIFKTREDQQAWIRKHEATHEIAVIYVNNAFGVEYRKCKVIA